RALRNQVARGPTPCGRAVEVEALHSLVAGVRHEHALLADCDRGRCAELAGPAPGRAERTLEGPRGAEPLDPVVAPLGHPHISGVIDVDARGGVELAWARTGLAPLRQERAICSEPLHAVVPGVGQDRKSTRLNSSH